MKHKLLFRRFFASLLLLAVSTLSWAYDFEKNGIYYNILDGTSVEVTLGTIIGMYNGPWISIPASVTYNAQTYNVTSIGGSAFDSCSGLTSVTIPNSVTSIGGYAFEYCSSLTSITIPSSVTSIGDYTFNNCYSLTSITIPNSVTSIGESAFYGCTSLPVINNVRYADTYLIETTNKSLSTYNIKAGTRFIGSSAFKNCNDLTSITIPNSVTSIGGSAFRGCSGLTSITIPESVTSIGNSAFSGCSGLTSITIPNSVTSIGYRAFNGCSGLTSISVASGNTIFDSRNNCNAIIETATNTLVVGCKETIFPESVTSIGNSAFSGCSGLTSVCIPESVTSISYSAFSGCSALTSVSIPESVSSIGDYAFDGCSSLTSVHVYKSTPIYIGSDVFPNRSNATLYVPKGAKAAYEAASYWKQFKEIVERNTVDVTMSDAETRTFCSDQDLDFSEVSGLKAYIISGFSPSTGTLTLTPVTHVPSGTGLLLQGEPGDYDVPVLETDMYYTNLLNGVTEATVISPTEGEYTNFILANGAHGIGFYTLSESGELAAGKAYLQIPTAKVPGGDSGARCFILDFENGDATGIGFTRVTTPKEDGVYYDLMGRRVEKPSKGIYILNGKKIFIQKK